MKVLNCSQLKQRYLKTRFWFWFSYHKLMKMVGAGTLHYTHSSFLNTEKIPVYSLYEKAKHTPMGGP